MQLGKILPVVAVCVLCSVMAVNEVHGQTGPQVAASLEHDGENGQFNKLIHVKDNFYALIYVDRASCFLKTFEVTDDTIVELHVKTLSTRCTSYSGLVKVNDSYIVTAFGNTNYNVKVESFAINANGSFTSIDTANKRNSPVADLIKWTGDRVLLITSDSGSTGWFTVYDLDSSGNLTIYGADNRLREAGRAILKAVSYTHLTLPTTPYV